MFGWSKADITEIVKLMIPQSLGYWKRAFLGTHFVACSGLEASIETLLRYKEAARKVSEPAHLCDVPQGLRSLICQISVVFLSGSSCTCLLSYIQGF